MWDPETHSNTLALGNNKKNNMPELPDFKFTLEPGRVKPTRLAAKAAVEKKATVAKRSAKADRGKKAETDVQNALKLWEQSEGNREFNRLMDARAAGRVVKSAPADFEFFQGPSRERYGTHHGLIEVKSTRHAYRLSVDKVPQLARLVRRAMCGGQCGVLLYHENEKQWRALPALYLQESKQGASWDLTHMPTYPNVKAALKDLFPSVFTFGKE